jgi:hypothetical protein
MTFDDVQERIKTVGDVQSNLLAKRTDMSGRRAKTGKDGQVRFARFCPRKWLSGFKSIKLN